MTYKNQVNLLKQFAGIISKQPLTLIDQQPEPGARVSQCFANAQQKADQDGGSVQYGWIFAYRLTETFSSPGYYMATHHAVWRGPNTKLIDVTPFDQDVKHQPLGENKRVFFLVDDKAKPVPIEGLLDQGGPLPIKFFPLSNGSVLRTYVDEMTVKEETRCQAYYQYLTNQIKASQLT